MHLEIQAGWTANKGASTEQPCPKEREVHGPNPGTCLKAGTTPAAEAGDTFKLLQDQGITDKGKNK